MAGKSVLCLVSSILLFSISVPVCLADEDAEIYKQKENICSLIEAGKFAEARIATDKMTVEFPGLEKLPDMLYWIAERYQRFDRFEDAKQIYQQIIRDFPESPWTKKAKFSIARVDVIRAFLAQDYTSANEQIEKLAVNYKDNSDLPGALFWLAERYQRVDKFNEAKQIYQRIIDDFPAGPYTQKAKLAISRAQIESLIVSQKYDDANTAIDKLIADFAKSPDLPGAIFWLTERYERLARLEEAKQNYQRIIDQFPNHLYAKKAKLGIQRAEVIAIIEAGDYNKADIALNKMTTDFTSDSDMPWSLYLIAQRYESKGKQADANSVYQQIVQNYADSQYASKVATEKKIYLATENTEVTENKEQKSISYLTADSNQEKAAIDVYRVARGYEEANDFNSAAKAYEQVIKDYPATIKGSNAVLDIRRLEILKAIDSNEANLADILLAKFVEDFNQNPYAGDCLDLLVDKCYSTGFELRRQNKPQLVNNRFAFAENVLQIMIDKKTGGNSTIGNGDSLAGLYYYAAGCRQHQGKWDGAIKYFQKVADNNPGFQYAWNAQLAIGWCYEALRDKGNLPKEAINPLIEDAYKTVLDKYPDCNMVFYAAYRLAEMNVEKGNKADATKYYKKFLESAVQGDPRIEKVKAKIASLEENK